MEVGQTKRLDLGQETNSRARPFRLQIELTNLILVDMDQNPNVRFLHPTNAVEGNDAKRRRCWSNAHCNRHPRAYRPFRLILSPASIARP